MNLIASSPEGLEKYLAREIFDLGGFNVKPHKRSVSFECDYATLYRIHFFSRVAFRFYRKVSDFVCHDRKTLYEGVRGSFDWLQWLPFDKTFNVQVTGKNSFLSHSHFTALEVKNAIIDLQRYTWNKRSNISLDNPDLIIHLHLNNDLAVISLQTSIESLHKRGYRPASGNAPLKENLASGLLKMTEWDGRKPLLDLMCGSGTFLIEAINQVLEVPLKIKEFYLFENWLDFEKDLYLYEKKKAQEKNIRFDSLSKVIGYEINREVFDQAKENVSLAGLSQYIDLKNDDFKNLKLNLSEGLILCNPPYGKRIGDEEKLIELYKEIGEFLKKNFSGWEFWLLSGNPKLTRYLKMKSSIKIPVSNGGIECRWIKYLIR